VSLLKYFFFALFFCTGIVIQAQNLEWAKTFGSFSIENAYSLTVDSSGNVYTVGDFYGTVDFDPNSTTFNLTAKGASDVYIQKLDSKGDLVWAKSMGGKASDIGLDITIDEIGNLYIVGGFQDTADFDPDTSTYNLIAGNSIHAFIVKLDSGGRFVWAKSFGNHPYTTTNVVDVELDHFGNIFTTGSYWGTIDLDPDTSTLNFTSNGITDCFVQKFDNKGNLLWAESLGSIYDDYGFSLQGDQLGNMYIVGQFRDTVDFNPDTSQLLIASNGAYDAFIQKIDSNNNLLWVKTLGGKKTDQISDIGIDNLGAIYLLGAFEDTVDFNLGTAVHKIAPYSPNFVDAFILKLDTQGNFNWVKTIQGRNVVGATSIATDLSGNIYSTGSFRDLVDFDPGSGVHNKRSNGVRASDYYLLKLDSSGNFIWVETFGGTQNDNTNELVVDNLNNIYLCGEFHGTINLALAGNTTNNFPSNGQRDCFIQKLSEKTVVGINSQQLKHNSLAYPNPTSGSLNIDLDQSYSSSIIIIRELSGKIVLTKQFTSTNRLETNIENLRNGSYLMEVYIDKLAPQYLKVLKQ